MVLVIAGIYQAVTGTWAIVAPESFFDTLGAFGVRNDHYLFDFGSFAIPVGLALLAAVKWPSWRVPALAIATGHWVLHTVSHLVDTNHHQGQALGLFEGFGLLVTAALMALALWFAAAEESRAD
ncbi:hypothetical protein BKG83_12255 [Mycobacteroides chelonae]|nr:hypothetical protein [Mycobacteroides chelonae]AYM44535.1 hypothetical protein DYE20_06370 [[Mycobacterium] chelonae subsp. gwanakae]PKQ56595.1 hypothetical protein B5566_19030 [Mycobacterium sp. MHSD3]MBF9520440.1 hypothetical protein [Mycobacteroides chelonae]OHU12679.1 hypothetical protein BKG75_22905 [Mycobacteroides chelonae]OHU56264.1 hypothetical protein BKG83_12255 [Mycobacteroides chelonae]